MKNKLPKTISLREFTKNLSSEDHTQIQEEIQSYDLFVKLKQARKQQGLSQVQLAQKAHINRTSISKIETGLRNATIGSLQKIARALDMTLEIKLH